MAHQWNIFRVFLVLNKELYKISQTWDQKFICKVRGKKWEIIWLCRANLGQARMTKRKAKIKVHPSLEDTGCTTMKNHDSEVFTVPHLMSSMTYGKLREVLLGCPERHCSVDPEIPRHLSSQSVWAMPYLLWQKHIFQELLHSPKHRHSSRSSSALSTTKLKAAQFVSWLPTSLMSSSTSTCPAAYWTPSLIR